LEVAMSRNHPTEKGREGTAAIILTLLTITAVVASYPPTSQAQESAPDSCASSRLKDIEEEAKSGTAAAQRELADIYAQGRCVTKDYTKSAYWYIWTKSGQKQSNFLISYSLASLELPGPQS
jgi:TPR repeat protein